MVFTPADAVAVSEATDEEICEAIDSCLEAETKKGEWPVNVLTMAVRSKTPGYICPKKMTYLNKPASELSILRVLSMFYAQHWTIVAPKDLSRGIINYRFYMPNDKNFTFNDNTQSILQPLSV